MVIIAGVVNPVIVRAQDEPSVGPTQEEAKREEKAERQARLDANKTRLETKLSASEERRLKSTCKAGQVISARLVENLNKIQENRLNAYTKVSEKLTSIIEKLKLAEIDTTALEESLVSFNAQSSSFLDKITEYKATISDLSEMDCESDPTAFKATLETAKEQRVALVSSSQALRMYIKDTIKPILVEIRTSLSAKAEQEG